MERKATESVGVEKDDLGDSGDEGERREHLAVTEMKGCIEGPCHMEAQNEQRTFTSKNVNECHGGV